MNKETALSLLLAFVVVFGGVALLNKSMKPLSNNTTKQSPEKESNSEPRNTYSPVEQSPKITPRAEEASESGIYKCILAGKITYSEAKCPEKAKSTVVKIENSEGIVTPDRETVNSTMRRIIAENRQNRNQEQTASVTSVEIRKKISPFCDNYKSQIEYLDTQAQQRNTLSVAERIKQERANIQKLQLNGNCYNK